MIFSLERGRTMLWRLQTVGKYGGLSSRVLIVWPSCAQNIFLRVEFLLKTDSGYPIDTCVTLFTRVSL